MGEPAKTLEEVGPDQAVWVRSRIEVSACPQTQWRWPPLVPKNQIPWSPIVPHNNDLYTTMMCMFVYVYFLYLGWCGCCGYACAALPPTTLPLVPACP